MAKHYGMTGPAEGPSGLLRTPLAGRRRGVHLRLCGDTPTCRAYFIENVETGRIKVGRSRKPDARLLDLQAGNDCELRLIGHIAADDYTEKRLHALFAEHHVRGEWFLPAIRPVVAALLENEPDLADASRRASVQAIRAERSAPRRALDAANKAAIRRQAARESTARIFEQFGGNGFAIRNGRWS